MKIDKLAEAAVQSVKSYIDKTLANVNQRIGELQKSMEQMATTEAMTSEISKQVSALNLKDGKDGLPGAKGEPGQNGKDADPEEIKKLVKEAVAEIPLPKNGEDGAPGKDGESVRIEDVIPSIREEIEKQVSKIPQAKDGQDGRDALQIEIEPVINPEKSYPRGTYAMHKGGLWRSQSNTHEMRGWECLVDGIEDIQIDLEDERNLKISVLKSSGVKTEKTFSIPVMIYREIYKHGGFYQKGDVVTFAGSVWHCNEDTDQRPGTGSKAWKLAVKRGRDAKEPVKIGGEK